MLPTAVLALIFDYVLLFQPQLLSNQTYRQAIALAILCIPLPHLQQNLLSANFWTVLIYGLPTAVVAVITIVCLQLADEENNFKHSNPHIYTQPQRINVVGTSGGGKSYYGKQLAKQLNCQYIDMDALFWKSNWTFLSDDEMSESVRQAVSGDKWVLDGNFTRLIPVKWATVQCVVWLDYSLGQTIVQSVRRAVERIWHGKEIWPGTGNKETLRQTFFSKKSVIYFSLSTRKKLRANYMQLFNDPQYQHIQMIRLRSRAEAAEFLQAVARASYE